MKSLEDELKKYSTTNRKKSYIWKILLLLIIVASLIFAYQHYFKEKETKYEFNTQSVTRGDLDVVVSATGNLNPTNSVEIGIEVSGTIEEIYVDFNDEVEVGQVLARLDTTKLQSQVDSSVAALSIARASLKESEVSLEHKKTLFKRLKRMQEETGGKYPSESELDDAKYAYLGAISTLEGAKARVIQSEYNLKTDRENLEKAHVKSSINGIVLNKEVEIGQTLAASMSAPKLFTLAKDLKTMDLIVSIDEADVADIKKGLNVNFTVDAYPSRTFEGVIRQVRLNPVTVNGVVTYETLVEVNNEELLLKPGMTANAKIVTKSIKNQLLVPNGALRFKPKVENKTSSTPKLGMGPRPRSAQPQQQGAKEASAIYILHENMPKEIRVKVVDSDGKLTAIKSDELKENDSVIVSQKVL